MPDVSGLRPLTARSAVLSTLLGAHPPRLPARSLVRVGELFGIAEGTIRVALSRMVAAGDLVQSNGDYAADVAAAPAAGTAGREPRPGGPAVVRRVGDRRGHGGPPAAGRAHGLPPDDGRAAAGRAARGHVAAPREPGPAARRSTACVLLGRPDGDPADLARSLWDLGAWAARARELRAALDEADATCRRRFILAAAVLRHFVADPLLPAELLPPDWPGAALRARYEEFDTAFQSVLRAHLGIE